jgi:tetratricopeptide (TPR) repeat protein
MELVAAWSARPVFITSTFQDMQAERDVLRNFVFPALEEKLRARRQHLEWVDLRVGVPIAGETDEAKRELQVLKVCLDEVRRTRPFLVALIGDRYGWVAQKGRIAAAAAEVGFTTDVSGRSVTDLEIDFGVFADPEQRRRCLFYFRNPLPYVEMPDDVASRYSDAHATDPQAPERAARLKALKTRIEKEFADRTSPYHAAWDAAHHRVTGLEEWARQVEQDLWAELTAEHPAPTAEVTWQTAERTAVDDFAEDRAQDFQGRGDLLGDIAELLASPTGDPGPWGLCITGAPGSGKSAVFGEVHRRLSPSAAFVLSHAAAASPRTPSVDSMLRRWIDELATALGVPSGLAENADAEAVEAAFASLLGRMALRRRAVVLVDSLDQFEPTPRGRYVTWLPRLWPENARLLATAVPGEASQALGKRPDIQLQPLPPLSADDARKMIAAICARYHRTLEPEVVALLLEKSGPDGPACSNALWLVLAVEELNLLDADDFARAEWSYPRIPAAERIRALMCDMISAFPANIPGLYRARFDRAAELFGPPLAHAFLGVIAISRGGWRESDFRELLPKLNGGAWDELRFAQLRRTFRGQLRQRGPSGQWDVAHAQMRAAALDWLTPAAPLPFEMHRTIADHLLALAADDPLRQDETMLHLLGASQLAKAASYYADPKLPAAAVAGATRFLANAWLADQSATQVRAQLSGMLSLPGLRSATVGLVARRLLFDLHDTIATAAPRASVSDLLSLLRPTLMRLTSRDPGNFVWQRDLSVLHGKAGDSFVAEGKLPEALKAFQEGFDIARKLVQADPANTAWQRDLSVSYERVGDILEEQGNLTEALRLFRDSLVIRRRLAQENPDDAEWQNNISASYDRVGKILAAQGNLREALQYFCEGQPIADRLARGYSANASWQHALLVYFNNIGDVLMAQGELPQALQSFRDGLAIANRLMQLDPENGSWQLDLSISYERIGKALIAQSDVPGALKTYYEALSIRERLVQSDPGNALWKFELSASYLSVGDAHVAQGKLAEALKFFRGGLSLADRLVRADQSNARWQYHLGIGYERIGSVLAFQGDLNGAMESFSTKLAIIDRLAQADRANGLWQRDLSVTYNKIGDVLVAADRIPEALKLFHNAMVIRERLARAAPANAFWQRDLLISSFKLAEASMKDGDFANARVAITQAISQARSLIQRFPAAPQFGLDLQMMVQLARIIEQAAGNQQ